jgi:hypothetical protein
MREIEGLLASSGGSSAGTTVPTGLVVLAVGLILCFGGVRSLRLTGFLVGFALAALLADVLGADPLISLIIGVAGGIAGFVLLTLAFRFSLWLIGGLVGAVIGVRAYLHFFLGEGNALVLALFLFAVGLICGFLAVHFRQPVLAVLTAAGGARSQASVTSGRRSWASYGNPSPRLSPRWRPRRGSCWRWPGGSSSGAGC